MEYCLNIDTNNINNYIYNNKNTNSFNFTFLDCIKDNLHGYDIIYKLLINNEEFKMKNIYNYIYNRVLLLHELYDIGKINKINIQKKITYEEINNLLFNYINNDIIKCIVIINSIQQY